MANRVKSAKRYQVKRAPMYTSQWPSLLPGAWDVVDSTTNRVMSNHRTKRAASSDAALRNAGAL